MKTWITISIVALLPMLLRTPKALAPIHVSATHPHRLTGLFRRYRINLVTGHASDVGKRSDSYTKGSTNVSSTYEQPVNVTTQIDTKVVVTDRFFLTDAQGKVTSFESSSFGARVGNGHVASLAAVGRGRRGLRRNFLIYNQTTGERFFDDEAIRKVLTFPYPRTYIGILILAILPIPVLILFTIAEWWQRSRFKSSGMKPLIALMDESGASLPTSNEAATADVSASLRELADLHSSGALSQAEYEQAKARVLGSSPTL